jgi:ribosomal protein L29
MNKEKIDFKAMTPPQLQEKVELWRQELLGLNFTASSAHVKDYSQFSKIKKNIARALTHLNQKIKDH